VLAQPAGSVDGALRLTEQGEVIASKYADPEAGRRNLETLAAATLEASLLHTDGKHHSHHEKIAEQLSAAAFQAYRELVQAPGFVEYFRASTPIAEIAELNIGSRPASRLKGGSSSDRIVDLRAIPWVFSWSQCRLMLPGWYGFGAAVETWGGSLAELQEMYEWPFFRSGSQPGHGVADRLRDLALCRVVSTGKLRRRFARISGNGIARESGWPRSPETGVARRQPDSRARSATASTDPLNHVQVELLRRYCSGERRTALADDHPTINGLQGPETAEKGGSYG
jgi:phosphoenolpyruvate carboxylase